MEKKEKANGVKLGGESNKKKKKKRGRVRGEQGDSEVREG